MFTSERREFRPLLGRDPSAISSPPVEALERARLSQVIAQRLEATIREGRLLPGERLPGERDLSERFGVSRPVLREALQRLQETHLVVTRRGKGTFVRDLSEDLSQAAPRHWLASHYPAVREFYEARLVLEPECAARAAELRTDSQMVKLKQLLAAAEAVLAAGKPLVFTGLDIDFHTCIAEMSGNKLLQRMLSVIINPEADLRQVLHRVPGHLGVSHSRHARIATAIEAADAAEARLAMRSALQGTLADIDDLLKGGDVHKPAQT